MLDDPAQYPLSEFFRNKDRYNHRRVCDQACYQCLHRYGNQMYHGLLDWRLGLSFLETLRDSTHLCGLDGDFSSPGLTDWRNLAGQYAGEMVRLGGRGSVRQVGGLSAFSLDEAGQNWALVVHPLWDCEQLPGVVRHAYDELNQRGYSDRVREYIRASEETESPYARPSCSGGTSERATSGGAPGSGAHALLALAVAVRYDRFKLLLFPHVRVPLHATMPNRDDDLTCVFVFQRRTVSKKRFAMSLVSGRWCVVWVLLLSNGSAWSPSPKVVSSPEKTFRDVQVFAHRWAATGMLAASLAFHPLVARADVEVQEAPPTLSERVMDMIQPKVDESKEKTIEKEGRKDAKEPANNVVEDASAKKVEALAIEKPKEETVEKASDLPKEQTAEKAGDLPTNEETKLKADGAEQVKDKVSAVTSDSKDAVNKAEEKATPAKVGEKVSAVTSDSKDAVNKAEEKATATTAKAEEKASEVTGDAKDAAKKAEEKVTATTAKVGEKASEAASDAKDVAKKAEEKVTATAAKVGEKASEAASDAKDAAKKAEEKVTATAAKVEEKASEVVGDAKDAAKKAEEKVTVTTAKVADKASEAATDVKDAAKKAEEKVTATTAEVADKASEVATDAKDAAKKAEEKVAATTAKVGEKASEVATDAKDAAKKMEEKATATTAKAGEKASEVATDAKDTVKKTEEKVTATTAKVADKASEGASDAKDAVNKAEEKVTATTAKVGEKASEVVGDAKDTAKKAEEKVTATTAKVGEKASEVASDAKDAAKKAEVTATAAKVVPVRPVESTKEAAVESTENTDSWLDHTFGVVTLPVPNTVTGGDTTYVVTNKDAVGGGGSS